MENNLPRIGTICARGGSKGLINKNIKLFFGKPMIAHVIEIAKKSGIFDTLAVSSDSQEIHQIAKACGVEHLIQRPLELASDTAAKLPAIQHCVSQVQKACGQMFGTVVDLSVTSPLMLPEDIKGAVDLLENSGAINVVSGALSSTSPYFNLVERESDNTIALSKKAKNYVRRQDCPPCYKLNGAIYVWDLASFFALKEVITHKTLLYVMPQERSIDIDSEMDFHFAEFVYGKMYGS